MKKLLILFCLIFAGCISIFANGPKPKLFPEVEKFYASLSGISIPPTHEKGFDNLSKYILRGTATEKPINLVFSDKDNSFVSQAAEIILSSLLKSNKISKLRLFSCGAEAGSIHPLLLKVLSKHGFKVSEATTASGKKAYNVEAGENMPPTNIFSKGMSDPSLLYDKCFQLKMCSNEEPGCVDLNNAFFKENLPFAIAPAEISEEDADKLFSQIAAEIIKAFNQANK